MWYKCLDCIFQTNSPKHALEHDRQTDHTTVGEADV
jgi:hypothetical protein